MRAKTFALVDCNNFYCSCERLFRPDLKQRPVVVLSNNDGCIVSRSQEAKQLGIGMAVPLFKVRKLIAAHDIQVFSSNYALYGDISARVMETLEELTPQIEIYSIDEAFLGLDGFDDPERYARSIRKTVDRHVGVPVSVGIAPTKTLAKLANFMAKKNCSAQGVVNLTAPEKQRRALAGIPVSAVWGIGRRHTQSLERIGIRTALQLAEMDTALARQRYSVVMARTIRELNGEACIDLERIAPVKQQIVCSRSFGEKITAYAPLRTAVCEFAARAAAKLRREKLRTAAVTLSVRTSPFDPHGPYYRNTATLKLEPAGAATNDIVRAATRLLAELWKEGPRYAKAGVMLSDFSPEGREQYPLFPAASDRQKHNERLMRTLDEINNGVGKIWFGGQRPQQDWFMTRTRLSPSYTTRWDCLPRVG